MIQELNKNLVLPATSSAAAVVCVTVEFNKETLNSAQVAKEWADHLQAGHSVVRIAGRPFGSAGFLPPKVSENHVTLQYVREGSQKIERLVNFELVPSYLCVVTPSSKVRVQALVGSKSVAIRFFGGREDVLAKARDAALSSLKSILVKHGLTFRESAEGFTPAQMKSIFDRLGSKSVKKVSIGAGECEKLKQYAEEKTKRGEDVPKLLFDASVVIVGLNIKLSPLLRDIINESGVHVDVISCTLTLSGKRKVSALIDSSGRVLIRVSSAIANTSDDFSLLAEEVVDLLMGNSVVWNPQQSLFVFTEDVKKEGTANAAPAP